MPLEKNVENLLNFVTVLGGPASQPAAHGPRVRGALPRAQAATWAWARNSARLRTPPGPHLAQSRARRSGPSD